MSQLSQAQASQTQSAQTQTAHAPQFIPQHFIEVALKNNVLKFGEFTLKSGRISPYFLTQVCYQQVSYCRCWQMGMLMRLPSSYNLRTVAIW